MTQKKNRKSSVATDEGPNVKLALSEVEVDEI